MQGDEPLGVSMDGLYGAGGPEHVLLLSFHQDSLKKYTGKTLSEVAIMRGKSAEETAMDLIIQDSTRVGTAYFLMSEENVKKLKIKLQLLLCVACYGCILFRYCYIFQII